MSEINSDNREKDNKEESVKVPLMITNGMRQKLGELGLNKENISQLKPEDAWDILNGKKSYVETAGNAIPVPFPERKSDEKPLINKPEISPADKEEIEKLKKSINGVDNTEVSDKKNDNAEGNIGASKEWVRPERVKVEKTEEEKKHAADFLTKEILDKEDKDIKVSVKEVAREFRNLKNGEENLGKLRKYATIKKLNEEGLHIIRGEKAIEAYRQGKIEKFKEEIKQRDHERAVRIFEFTHAGLKEEQIEEFMEKEKNKLGLEGSEGTIVFDKLINGGYVVKEAKKSNFWFSKKNKIEKVKAPPPKPSIAFSLTSAD